MHRLFAVFALFVASLAGAQPTPTPPPPEPEKAISYTFVPTDITRPVVYIDAVGDTTGVARQLVKTVVVDSTMMANLPTQAIEIVPSPGADRILIADKLIWELRGTVMRRTPQQGIPLLYLAFSNDTDGFLSTTFGDPNYFNAIQVFDAQVALLDNTQDREGLAVPGGFGGGANLFADTAIKLMPVVFQLGQDNMGSPLTEAETWEGLTGNVSGDFEFEMSVFYQIYDR